MKKNAAIYARVSSVRQKEGENIQSQVSALVEYANKHDYTIPNGWIFKDEGFSGSLLQRPGLESLREVIHEGVVDAVLVYSPDRLSRKYAYQLVLEMEFQKQHTELIFLNTPKAQNPEDQLSLHFKSIFAEYERTQIIERCRRGRAYRAKQGTVSVIPSAPLGYDYVCKSATSLPQYVINADAEIVKKIFSYYIEKNLSVSKICRQLEADGILSPKGNKKWCNTSVVHTLKNEAYIGTSYFGKSEPCKAVEGQIYRTPKGEKRTKPISARKKRPKELWTPIKVPQIISESDFEQAQHKLEENKKHSPRNTRRPTILQGLLVCGYCGGTYYKKMRPHSQATYGCGRRLKGSNCCAPFVKQNDLDNIVWDHIINLLKDPSLIEEEMVRRTQENQDVKKIEENIRDLHNEVLRLARARDKLLDAYQEGDSLTLGELKERLKGIDLKQKSALKQKKSLEDINSCEQKIENMKIHMEDLRLRLENSENLSIEDKQSVLRLLVDEILITENQIEIKHCIPCKEGSSMDLSLLKSNSYCRCCRSPFGKRRLCRFRPLYSPYSLWRGQCSSRRSYALCQ